MPREIGSKLESVIVIVVVHLSLGIIIGQWESAGHHMAPI